MMFELTRTQMRRHLPETIRIERLEEDLDEADEQHEKLVESITNLTNKVATQNARLTTLIVTIAASALALSLQMVAGR